MLIDGRSREVAGRTDRDGRYLRWLDRAEMPLTLTTTAAGYEPDSRRVRPPGAGPSVVEVAPACDD